MRPDPHLEFLWQEHCYPSKCSAIKFTGNSKPVALCLPLICLYSSMSPFLLKSKEQENRTTLWWISETLLKLTGEAQWSMANQGTQEHEDPTLEETRGSAPFLSPTEGLSLMRMNIWNSFLFRNRTFSQLCFIILEECFQTVTQCQRKQSSVFHQSAGHLMEFNGTIYLSKLTGITLSRTEASRKVHAPQLQRYMRTGREFWLLYCYYFRSIWRIDLINVSKLELPSLKSCCNSTNSAVRWVDSDWIVSSSGCAGSARQRETHLNISL